MEILRNNQKRNAWDQKYYSRNEECFTYFWEEVLSLSLNFEVERIIDRNTYPILIITHIHITIKGHLRSDTNIFIALWNVS